MGEITKMRNLKVTLEEELVKRVEDAFCYATVEGTKVKVRALVSVTREAILRGLKIMVEEQKALRKIYGENVFLTESGVLFAKDMEPIKPEEDEDNESTGKRLV